MNAGQSHITSILVERDAGAVFAFMADPGRLDRWSFGTWETKIAPDGLVEGKSLFDGSTVYVRIDADAPRGSIDFHIGAEPGKLSPRINVRVVPGPTVGLPADQSVLTFVAWRGAAMDDLRWRRLTASHELEVVLIKSLIENG
ncbi:MAG: hypothetical protein AB7S41_10395 [Parvibaculaceae bacterium]